MGVGQIKKFEDIEAWQMARELTGLIYNLARKSELANDYGLKNQLCRAAAGTMANIAEGFGRGGNKEFVQFLSIARGSGAEVQSLLYVAKDSAAISQEQFEKAYKLADEMSAKITGFITYLRNSGYRGGKFK